MASRYSSQSGWLTGDAAEVVDQTIGRLGHVQHLGVPVDLHPGTVPVIGEDEHRDPGVVLGLTGLRAGRIGEMTIRPSASTPPDTGEICGRPSRRVVASSSRAGGG